MKDCSCYQRLALPLSILIYSVSAAWLMAEDPPADARLNRRTYYENVLLVGEDEGAVLQMGGVGKFLDFTNLIPSRPMWSTVDHQGRCWLSGMGGVMCLDGENVVVYGREHGLPDLALAHVFEDSRGRIWVGSYGGGVSAFDGKNWRQMRTSDGLSDDQANACAEDWQGRVWIGCDKGVSIYDNNAFDRAGLTVKLQLGNVDVKSMIGDAKGRIYLGCIGGLMRVGPDLNSNIITPRDGLPQKTPQAVYIDSKDRIWVGTWGGGVAMIDPVAWKVSKEHALPEAGHVRRIVEDSNGRIWVAAIEGLWILREERWTKVMAIPLSMVATVPDAVARQLLDLAEKK